MAGFDVLEAPNGYEAIHSVERQLPDVIVLDLLLPGFGGLSVQRDIADRAMTRHIPIVIVTGSTRPLDNLAVACVLRKPVDPDELVAKVRECLEEGPAGYDLWWLASRTRSRPVAGSRCFLFSAGSRSC